MAKRIINQLDTKIPLPHCRRPAASLGSRRSPVGALLDACRIAYGASRLALASLGSRWVSPIRASEHEAGPSPRLQRPDALASIRRAGAMRADSLSPEIVERAS
jgi:hypothetical protein